MLSCGIQNRLILYRQTGETFLGLREVNDGGKDRSAKRSHRAFRGLPLSGVLAGPYALMEKVLAGLNTEVFKVPLTTPCWSEP